MSKPNVYVLSSKPEIDVVPTDLAGVFFVPNQSRLSIQEPSGNLITVSGADLTTASGYLYYLYQTSSTGWVEYEFWCRDGTGREVAASNGFEVVDYVLN